jgi:tetratricopeptide (TPR) repeat protein
MDLHWSEGFRALRHDPPAAPAVRDTLDRVLSSETFKRSERARSLLAYLVRREQAGQAERLKGYAIAVDVLGKDSEFDASNDAAVRVQAGRLRELLAHYYQAEGAGDPLRIVIPRGSYVPGYEKAVPCPTQAEAAAGSTGEERRATTAAPAAAEPPAAGAPLPRSGLPRRATDAGQLRLLWTALAVVAALLVVFLYRSNPVDMPADGTATAPPVESGAVVDPLLSEALPTVRILVKDDDPATARVASHFRTAFAGFDTLAVIGGEFLAGPAKFPSDPTGFLLALGKASGSGGVSIDLQSLGTGKVLLNRVMTASATTPEAVEDEVASIATSVAPVTGVIYGYLRQSSLESGLVECLTLSDAYYMDQTPARHATAYKCLERFADAGAKSPLAYAELAGLHVEAKTDGYFYPKHPSDERAMVFAKRGVQLGPTSPFAHRAMGFLYSRRGDTGESVRWMRKAYELNTYDLSMAASYGYALVFAGDYREGAAILERAVDASSAHPTWWDYSLFLHGRGVARNRCAGLAEEVALPCGPADRRALARRPAWCRHAGQRARGVLSQVRCGSGERPARGQVSARSRRQAQRRPEGRRARRRELNTFTNPPRSLRLFLAPPETS